MRILTVALLVALAVILTGTLAVAGYSLFNNGWWCAGNAGRGWHCRGSQTGDVSDDVIRATWVEASVEGYAVKVPLQEIDDARIIHFRVPGEGNDLVFMAYRFDGQIQVRAAICPPCRSENFSLSRDTIICDTCGTMFQAGTGEGISGGCQGYPKASLPINVSGDMLTLSVGDLIGAYENTRNPGWP